MIYSFFVYKKVHLILYYYTIILIYWHYILVTFVFLNHFWIVLQDETFSETWYTILAEAHCMYVYFVVETWTRAFWHRPCFWVIDSAHKFVRILLKCLFKGKQLFYFSLTGDTFPIIICNITSSRGHVLNIIAEKGLWCRCKIFMHRSTDFILVSKHVFSGIWRVWKLLIPFELFNFLNYRTIYGFAFWQFCTVDWNIFFILFRLLHSKQIITAFNLIFVCNLILPFVLVYYLYPSSVSL